MLPDHNAEYVIQVHLGEALVCRLFVLCDECVASNTVRYHRSIMFDLAQSYIISMCSKSIRTVPLCSSSTL
jgi:hypothetical protein